MALTDLKMSDKDIKAREKEMQAEFKEEDKYPYGLRVHLDSETTGKLDVGSLRAGQEVTFMARGRVKSVHASETDKDSKPRVTTDIQITAMEFEDGKPSQEEIANRLFPNS